MNEARKPWEGVFAVPDLNLETCPWCRQQRRDYCVVVFERAGQTETEVICNTCAASGDHYIGMRKAGLSRRAALEDFGFRSREVHKRPPTTKREEP